MMSMATGTTISQHMMIAATGMVPSHTPRTHTPPSGTLNGRVSSGRVERSQMRLRHTIEKATPVPRLTRSASTDKGNRAARTAEMAQSRMIPA